MVVVLPLVSLWFGYTGGGAARHHRVRRAVLDHHQCRRRRARGAARVSRGRAFVPLRPRRACCSRSCCRPRRRISSPALRLAAGRALIGAVVAEFFTAIGGLGYFILYNSRTFHHDEAFVGVLLLAAFGVGCRASRSWSTRRFLPWYRRDERQIERHERPRSHRRTRASLGHLPLGAALRRQRRHAHRFRGGHAPRSASWDDWCRAWSDARSVHEQLGREALARDKRAQRRRASAARRRLLSFRQVPVRARPRADEGGAHEGGRVPPRWRCRTSRPPGERVEIPYEGKTLYGILRKPPGVERPPVVVMIVRPRLRQGGDRRLRAAVPRARHRDAGLRRARARARASTTSPIRGDYEVPVKAVRRLRRDAARPRRRAASASGA